MPERTCQKLRTHFLHFLVVTGSRLLCLKACRINPLPSALPSLLLGLPPSIQQPEGSFESSA